MDNKRDLGPDRVVGIYPCPLLQPDADGYRVVSIAGGRRRSKSVEGPGWRATAYAAALTAEIARAAAQTVGPLLQEWIAAQPGLAHRTLVSLRTRVRWLLGESLSAQALAHADGDRLLAAAQKRSPYSVAAARVAVGVCDRFCRWLVRHRGLARNPFDSVEVAGKARKGDESHPQITRLQALAWLRAAHLRTDPPALAAALVLLADGRRTGDLLGAPGRPGLLVGGLDGEIVRGTGKGRVPYRRRIARLPEYPDLPERLAQLAVGRPADEPLFPGRPRGWLRAERLLRVVREICAVAEIPPVTPHGLRGTLATLAAEADVPEALAAAALGHTVAVHQAHYAKPEARADRDQAAALRALRGEKE